MLSSIFAFQEDATLVSYVPKRMKAVLLLSTLHTQPEISTEDHRKPQIILDYNHTKGGVDTLDQLVRTYSCKRKTNRWPFAIFCNLLDIMAYNAFVLYTSVHPQYQAGRLYRRRLFLLELSKSMLPEFPRVVAQPRDVNPPGRVVVRAYRRCSFCSRANDKKTRDVCGNCGLSICKDHSHLLCPNCS